LGTSGKQELSYPQHSFSFWRVIGVHYGALYYLLLTLVCDKSILSDLWTDAASPGGGATTPSRQMESAVAEVEKPVSVPVEVDMRHYNSLMSAVPLESTSIPLIIYCMLEQVFVSTLSVSQLVVVVW